MAQKKAVIIKVSEDKVSIGLENGKFFNVNRNELDFTPMVGDKVSVFFCGDIVIVTKVEVAEEKKEEATVEFPDEPFVQPSANTYDNFVSGDEENENNSASRTKIIANIVGTISAIIVLTLFIISFYSDDSDLSIRCAKILVPFWLVLGICTAVLKNSKSDDD